MQHGFWQISWPMVVRFQCLTSFPRTNNDPGREINAQNFIHSKPCNRYSNSYRRISIMSNETEAARNSPVRPSPSRALRVWPAVILVALMIVTRFVPAFLEGGLAKYWMFAMMGPLVCCLLVLIWWLAASRATWKELVFGFLGLAAVFAMIMALVEPLMRGPGTIYITLPMGMIAFVAGAALFQKRRPLA